MATEQKRMQLRGLHHVTAICRDLERTVAFYRDLMGLAVVHDSPEEQEAWRDYLRGQGVECTEVFDRGAFRSIYLRDPDGHIVEIATSGPGFSAGGPSA